MKVCALVLAAGAGTRMVSDLPKPAIAVGGRPLVHYVLDALPPEVPVVAVVGHQADVVTDVISAYRPSARFVVQETRGGTGHAVAMGLPTAAELVGEDGVVLVLPGDMPLLRPESIATFLQAHLASRAALSVLGAVVAAPTGYGRLLRGADASVLAIVEERDATDEEKRIREINTGVMVADVATWRRALATLSPHNAQGEIYLTDAIAAVVASGHTVGTFLLEDATEAGGVNTPAQAADVAAILATRRS